MLLVQEVQGLWPAQSTPNKNYKTFCKYLSTVPVLWELNYLYIRF